jgi:DNA invertase Pin-like site-specific DNA recombinase
MPDERTATRGLMSTARAPRQAAIYVRVSTADQNVANQQRELEGVAQRHGWKVVEVFSDRGVSGAKDKRPALDRLRQGIARKDFDVVAAWSVDRLGRSLQHLLGFRGELRAKNVDLYLHQQGLDTSTPAGKALFQMLGVFAEFERAIIIERVHAGLRRARAQGVKLGRPRVAVDLGRAVAMRSEGKSMRAVARALGVSAMAVSRALADVGTRNPAVEGEVNGCQSMNG